jgi:ATP-dependent RNA helicase UAP56/SUB2
MQFPSLAIHGDLPQEERIAHYQKFRAFEERICVATDVFGRGIDIEKINVVINYDMPDSMDTYLPRAGRAGRFGTSGLEITFVATDDEEKLLDNIQKR